MDHQRRHHSHRKLVTGAVLATSLALVGCAEAGPQDATPSEVAVEVTSAAPTQVDSPVASPNESTAESTSEAALLTRDVTEMAPNVYQISDYKLVSYYLIVGSEKAVVIDAGIGMDDPLPGIRELTDKPLELVLTHGHPDHVGMAHYFDTIWMNPADEEISRTWYEDPSGIEDYIRSRTDLRNPGEGHADFLVSLIPEEQPDAFEYQELTDGMTFDLGDRVLEVFATPGHTEGSMSVLDAESRLLFTGDALNPSSIIPNKPGGTRDEIAAMAETFETMQERSSEFDQTAPGHDGVKLDKQLIEDYLTLVNGLLSGELEGEYEESGIRAGKVVRHGMAELWYEADK